LLASKDIQLYIKGLYGKDVPLSSIDQALSTIDMKALDAKHRQRVTWAPHNHGELVNNIDFQNHPNEFIRSVYNNMKKQGGVAYKIHLDGKLQVFQYFKPFVQGFQPIAPAEMTQVVQDHVNWMVTELVNQEALSIVIQTLKGQNLL